MDLETYHLIHAWPEIPEDPEEVIGMVVRAEISLDSDLQLYLWARTEKRLLEGP